MNKLNHVAFIMDGNGRWGTRNGKGRQFGHIKGVEVVKNIIKSALKLNIPILSFYVFSSENWKRPKKEINFLFRLISNYFNKEIHNISEKKIKLNILGDIKSLPKNTQLILQKINQMKINSKKILVNLAINYGSRDEIIFAINKTKKKINKKNFENNLYTNGLPDPDILIRTGGYKRLSNFLLWQLAYTELFFLDKLWPDFNSQDLKKIIVKFKKIKRNYGSL